MLINLQKLKELKLGLMTLIRSTLKYQWFYLLGIFASTAILHLEIVANLPNSDEGTAFYALYWGGILFLFWQKRYQANYPTLISSLLGLVLMAIVVLRPFYFWQLDLILFRVGPVIFGLGIGLLSFGFSGLKHYWQLFLLLCLMVLPLGFFNEILNYQLHFPEVTANVAAFFLHYIGFTSVSQGNVVKLPTGQVEVIYFCTGGLLIFWLLKITLLILVVVTPLTWQQRWKLILSAISTGFFIGCIRVSWLALIVNNSRAFHYWHSYTGGSIFMSIATIIYAFLCNWILPTDYLLSDQSFPEKSQLINAAQIQLKRCLLLSATWISISIAVLYTAIFSKYLGLNNILPDKLVINNWQQIGAKSLPLPTVSHPNADDPHDVDTKNTIAISQKYYSYTKNRQRLDLQMLYEVASRSDANPFLEQLNPNLQRDIAKNMNFKPGIGYYISYTDSRYAHFTACINPRGMSTVNSHQFNQNRYRYDINWGRLTPWIFGKTILKDNRCIWAQLSTPLNGKVATEAYTMLESIWSENYYSWQSLFLKKELY
jgi:cyanoexosortase A